MELAWRDGPRTIGVRQKVREMAYYDLREFIAACDKAGEVVTIDKEIDWNLEAGPTSEFVIEGRVRPHERLGRGPLRRSDGVSCKPTYAAPRLSRGLHHAPRRHHTDKLRGHGSGRVRAPEQRLQQNEQR